MNKENAILFLGDVAPYKPYKFKNTIKTVINLECPITRTGSPAKDKIILGAKENYLKDIFNSTLLGVNVANNHILDYGVMGLDSTISELKKSGIDYFGLNEEGNNPRVIEFNKFKIAFISAICETTSPIYAYDDINYLSDLNAEEIIHKIKKIKEDVDRVVICIHWGVEESSYPSTNDIRTARRLIDGGADIVIGTHAHAPQAIEKYKNGIIAHNLGNFIMPEMKNFPSYYDEMGIPQSSFTSRVMLWNRISWGLIIDMETLEFRIKKYMLLGNKIIELPFTPLDKYLKLNKNVFNATYESIFIKHVRRREFQRKIIDFIYNPHVPQKLKRKL